MKNFNMKLIYVAFLCAVFCFGWSTQNKFKITIPTPIVLELRQQAGICEQETGIPASHLKKIIDKTLPNDKANNDFFYCVLFGKGFVDKDGHLTIEKMSAFQAVDSPAEDYINAIKECNKISKDNSVDTLVAIANCVHDIYNFAPAAQQ